MNRPKLALMISGVAALMGLVLVVGLLVVKLLWAWTVPDLFPGAVEQGLIAADISWLAAFKVALFVAVVAGMAGAKARHET